MADGMREKTANVGGVIKRIWYAMTGATQGAELASLDDTGKFKCVTQQITGLAGAGTRIMVVDSAGNTSAPLNNFKTTYTEGTISSVENAVWTVLMGCPVGRVEIAITTAYEPFATTDLYYSQASFARATGGTPVTLYAANGGTAGTQIRLNGNNIEIMQTSGATVGVNYRYALTSARY